MEKRSECCANCYFAYDEGVDKDTLEHKYTCNIKPAVGQLIPAPNGAPIAVSFWPPVAGDRWCGEWRPTAQKAGLQ